jgi:hypothetical protein
MHRLSHPQQPAAGPFGKAGAREVDGENAERNASERKMTIGTIRIARRAKKSPKNLGFCGVEFR